MSSFEKCDREAARPGVDYLGGQAARCAPAEDAAVMVRPRTTMSGHAIGLRIAVSVFATIASEGLVDPGRAQRFDPAEKREI